MTRATAVEIRARQIAFARYGDAGLWTVCISEASQQITLAILQAKRAM
jgi:hypothetical protein